MPSIVHPKPLKNTPSSIEPITCKTRTTWYRCLLLLNDDCVDLCASIFFSLSRCSVQSPLFIHFITFSEDLSPSARSSRGHNCYSPSSAHSADQSPNFHALRKCTLDCGGNRGVGTTKKKRKKNHIFIHIKPYKHA